MSETKHTPIPDYPRYQTKEQWEADACLIAAALEMWEACQAALEYDAAIQRHAVKGQSWVEGDDLDALYDKWITATRAAIAKVTEDK